MLCPATDIVLTAGLVLYKAKRECLAIPSKYQQQDSQLIAKRLASLRKNPETGYTGM
jgi:hypothetical protein